jgi:hypothetical protein
MLRFATAACRSVAVAVVLAAVLFVSLAGCEGRAPRASHGSCVTGADCTDPGTVCVEGTCTTACNTSNDCPDPVHQDCRNGICVDGGCNCPEAFCTDGYLSYAQSCTSTGQCAAPNPSGGSCAPYACDAAGRGCLTSCGSPLDCAGSLDCLSSGVCEPPRLPGSDCQVDVDCASGACLGDRCCTAACTTGGICGAGSCDDTGACVYPTGVCSAQTCDGDHIQSNAANCLDGTCAPTTLDCSPYSCNGTTGCRTSCTSNADCVSGGVCSGVECVSSAAPQLASFGATPAVVVAGIATNVAWSWQYVNTPTPVPSCSINHGVGTMTSDGTSTITLAADTTYALTCTNSAGSDSLTTTIVAAPCGALDEPCCAGDTCTQLHTLCHTAGVCAACAPSGITQHAPTAFGLLPESFSTIAPIDASHFLATYRLVPGAWSACADSPAYATILTANTTTGTVWAGHAILLSGLFAAFYNGGTFLSGALQPMDATRMVFVHAGCTDAGNPGQGYAEVLTLDLAGDNVSHGAPLVFDSIWDAWNAVIKVDDTHVLIAYQTTNTRGVAAVLTVSGSTLALSASQSFGADGQGHSLAAISTNRFLDTYKGSGGHGAARVITVGLSPISVQLGAEQTFDDSVAYSSGSLWAVGNQTFLVVYGVDASASEHHGKAALLRVDAVADTVSVLASLSDLPIAPVSDTSSATVRAVPVGDNYFLATYTTGIVSDGQAVPLAVTVSPLGIVAGSAGNCNAAGCARVLVGIDSEHLLGLIAPTDQKLQACVMNVDCALP